MWLSRTPYFSDDNVRNTCGKVLSMDWPQFCKKVSLFLVNSALSCHYLWEVSGQLICPFLCFPFFYLSFVSQSRHLRSWMWVCWDLDDLLLWVPLLQLFFCHLFIRVLPPLSISLHTQSIPTCYSPLQVQLSSHCLNLQMISNCGRDRNLKCYFDWMRWGVLLQVGFA